MLLTDFGCRLRAARLQRKLSSQHVADRARVSRMTLFRAEKGEPAVALGTYLRILEVLELAGDLALVAKAGKRRVVAAVPAAKSFKTADEMSAYQQDRELAEALKVLSMSPRSFSLWLESSWGRLQDEANQLYIGVERSQKGFARHFKTPDEKNGFDRRREIDFAVKVSSKQG
jgi:transcriptional regulator with XRE-family HTH domain